MPAREKPHPNNPRRPRTSRVHAATAMRAAGQWPRMDRLRVVLWWLAVVDQAHRARRALVRRNPRRRRAVRERRRRHAIPLHPRNTRPAHDGAGRRNGDDTLMDLTESIQPRSDQVNADDLVGGPITYTVREVVKGKAEQPFDFQLVETNRAYRPSKTMRRVIVAAWGSDASNYAGRRLTLYREPSIKFGGTVVGGIRISAMSHIDKPVEVMLQVTRGKREKFTVAPLAEPATVTDVTVAQLVAEFERVGVPEDKRLAGANHYAGASAASLDTLTEDQARVVLDVLAAREDA